MKNIFIAVSVVTLFNLGASCLANCETAKGKIPDYSKNVEKLREDVKSLAGFLDRQVVKADLSVAKSAIKNLQRVKQDKKCADLQATIDLSLAQAQAKIEKSPKQKMKSRIHRPRKAY